MKAKIGSDDLCNAPNYNFLENKGRVYGSYRWVDATRMRSLEGVPVGKVTSLSLDPDISAVNLEDAGQNVHFCVIQESHNKVPVFMLPATQHLTVNMSNEERSAYIKKLFDECYKVYRNSCTDPVPPKYCAATVVAGTKTMWGGDHFTAMIKPPGDDQWMHVDPTDFGGPQKFNRKQCGGYSSMIEAEALMHYSSKTIADAENDEKQGTVLRFLQQFIDTLAFKFNTWFAGAKNEVIRNSENKDVPHGTFETTYAEMADFSAGRLARKFNNKEFIDARIKGKGVQTTEPTIESEIIERKHPLT